MDDEPFGVLIMTTEINPDHLEEVPEGWPVEAWCAYLETVADEYERKARQIVEAIERFRREADSQNG